MLTLPDFGTFLSNFLVTPSLSDDEQEEGSGSSPTKKAHTASPKEAKEVQWKCQPEVVDMASTKSVVYPSEKDNITGISIPTDKLPTIINKLGDKQFYGCLKCRATASTCSVMYTHIIKIHLFIAYTYPIVRHATGVLMVGEHTSKLQANLPKYTTGLADIEV